jgi:DNA (cytosine-5)-methyltransferase 1
MATRPRLLDLFCGAGGASVGYHRAGFDVIGVDIKSQPRYPFEFVQADALEWLATADLSGVAAIHASPPCQDHSLLHRNYGAPEHGTGWLLQATIDHLRDSGRPWVVENVVGAPIPGAFVLCGGSFGLGASNLDLNRHRRFGTSFPMLAPPCQHRPGRTIGVYGNGTNSWHRSKLGRNLRIAEMRQAMGIDWMTRDELTQAIPPAYTEYVGGLLLAVINESAVA